MSFRGQVRRAFMIGLTVAALGFGLALAAVIFDMVGLRLPGQAAAWVSMLLIAAGALCGLAGAVARPVQRWAFLHGMPSGRLRAFALRQPVLRWWVWVDEAGRGRDD
jgi:hypothetical protein